VTGETLLLAQGGSVTATDSHRRAPPRNRDPGGGALGPGHAAAVWAVTPRAARKARRCGLPYAPWEIRVPRPVKVTSPQPARVTLLVVVRTVARQKGRRAGHCAPRPARLHAGTGTPSPRGLPDDGRLARHSSTRSGPLATSRESNLRPFRPRIQKLSGSSRQQCLQRGLFRDPPGACGPPGTHYMPDDANAPADCTHKKDLQTQAFSKAAERIRTLDLLHGLAG
jgi:hypothetical protein